MIIYFRAKADLPRIYKNLGVVYQNACNAVQAMKSNEMFTHENVRIFSKRNFYLTKITRYAVR